MSGYLFGQIRSRILIWSSLLNPIDSQKRAIGEGDWFLFSEDWDVLREQLRPFTIEQVRRVLKLVLYRSDGFTVRDDQLQVRHWAHSGMRRTDPSSWSHVSHEFEFDIPQFLRPAGIEFSRHRIENRRRLLQMKELLLFQALVRGVVNQKRWPQMRILFPDSWARNPLESFVEIPVLVFDFSDETLGSVFFPE